jgi:fatty acid desaturase
MSTLFDPASEPRDDDREDTAIQPTTTESTAPPATQPVAPSGARRPSVLHLVVGLVFLGLAGLWALAASGAVDSDDTWLIPGLLVVAGAAGLVAALAGGRRGTR